jgi:hypothetical protein
VLRFISSLHRPVVLAALACLLCAGKTASAQGTPQTPPIDAQVIVAPLPSGQWAISEVYPAQISRATEESRLNGLMQAGRWTANGATYEDRGLGLKRNDGKPLDRTHEDKQAPSDAVMSSASAMTNGKVVDITDGTIDIAPFVLSLRDLSRVNIVYLIPPSLGFRFRGFRHFEDSHLAADLAVRQGTYVYTVNIKDHRLADLALPRYEATQNAPLAAESGGGRPRALATTLILGLALGAGLLVYLWATRLTSGADRE